MFVSLAPHFLCQCPLVDSTARDRKTGEGGQGVTCEQAERQKLRCGVWGGLEPPRVGEKQGQRFRFLSNCRHRHGRPRTGRRQSRGLCVRGPRVTHRFRSCSPLGVSASTSPSPGPRVCEGGGFYSELPSPHPSRCCGAQARRARRPRMPTRQAFRSRREG